MTILAVPSGYNETPILELDLTTEETLDIIRRLLVPLGTAAVQLHKLRRPKGVMIVIHCTEEVS